MTLNKYQYLSVTAILLYILFYIYDTNLTLVLSNIIVLFFLTEYKKSFVTYAYSITIFFLYVAPVVVGTIFNVYHPVYVNPEIQAKALLYLFLYNSVVVSFFIFLNFFLKNNPLKITDFSYFKINSTGVYLGLILVFLLIALAKLYLNHYKFLTVIYTNDARSALKIPFLQLAKSLSALDTAFILIIAYFRSKKDFQTLFFKTLFYTSVAAMTFLSAQSGSRFSLIYLVIILIYVFNDFFRSHKTLIVIIGFLSFSFFKISSTFRNTKSAVNSDYTFFNAVNDTLNQFILSPVEYFRHIADVMTTRLNYIDIVGRVIDFDIVLNKSFSPYLQNFTGLVPRILWKDKPIIGLDFKQIGHDLFVIGMHDDKTSVGLGVIGESFFLLGLAGLSVAIFHSFLLYFVDVKLNSKNIIGYVMVPIITIYILSRDGFIAIIPGLVYAILPLMLILLFFNGYREKNNEK